MQLLDFCQPHHDPLAGKTRELVQLALLENTTLRFVAKVDGTERITLLGRDVDLHATTTGKAGLSTLPEDQTLAIVRQQGLQKFTSKTVVSAERLTLALGRAKDQRYAVVEEEHLLRVNAVAAPYRPARDGERREAVSVAGPTFRLTPASFWAAKSVVNPGQSMSSDDKATVVIDRPIVIMHGGAMSWRRGSSKGALVCLF